MSIAAKQLRQPFHGPNREEQQQRLRTIAHNHQQFSRNKSIDSTIENQEKYVTNKVIKQAAVAETEAEYKKYRSESEGREELIAKELENNYSIRQDYQFYQGDGAINKFFQHGILENPKRVADICLINDHYILVKMPDQEIKSNNHSNLAEATARRKEFRALKEKHDEFSKEAERNNRKLCRYLKSKRNRIRKISPIHEEPEDLNNDEDKSLKTPSKLHCLKIQSCCQANKEEEEVESYQTRTKIFKNVACDQQKIVQSNPAKMVTEKKPQYLKTKKPQDIQTVSGSLLKSSLHYQVSLQQYGSLIESQTNNNNDDLKMINSSRSRKCPRLESFHWLFRPFRAKYHKPKPKVQAVVYKTYFVKWTKPPDTLAHGYGVKTVKSPNVEMSVLRRCRSALF